MCNEVITIETFRKRAVDRVKTTWNLTKHSKMETFQAFHFLRLSLPQHRIQLRLHSENQLFARSATASAISTRENIQMNF